MQFEKMTVNQTLTALMCLVVSLTCVRVSAGTKFPFPAMVTEDVALVRAGAGTTYYVVKKLKKGEIVTVEQKIYKSWYKIVPPQRVYSYVSKAFVDAKGDGKVGIVNKTPCEVFTASIHGVADSFRRTTNLLKGDTVQIVAQDGGYYKIMPPQGTYVYIPASSVKPAAFEPARAAPTPASKPAATSHSGPAPALKSVPVPSNLMPKPVAMAHDAPRPLVIQKTQMGDKLPVVSKVVPVTQPILQPTLVAKPVLTHRPIPPIPDTDTPPVYTNWPPKPAAALKSTTAHDGMTTQKPVVKKPVITDRLEGPVPPKPALPQAPALATIKPMPPMPSFPNDMPEATVTTTLTDANTLPPIASPPPPPPPEVQEASSKVSTTPETTSVAIEIGSTDSMPQVNPLLASRGRFQPQSVTLGELEQRLIKAHQLPLDKRPLGDLLAQYQKIAKQSHLPIRDQRIVQARIAQLKRDIKLSNAFKNISSVQTSLSGSKPFAESFTLAPRKPAAPATPKMEHFDRVGLLLASAVYDGQNLPRLYRLVNPKDTRVTLSYIRPNDQINPVVHLGHVVGMMGKPEMDPTLHLNIITPKKVELFEPAP